MRVEQRMGASVEITAPATHAIASESGPGRAGPGPYLNVVLWAKL